MKYYKGLSPSYVDKGLKPPKLQSLIVYVNILNTQTKYINDILFVVNITKFKIKNLLYEMMEI